MTATIIGIDAHKRSHTAVVLDAHNEIRDQLRLAADRRQLARLLAWADRWPNRIWAIDNVGGLGRLLGQQLAGSGETVVDVPASMTARTRRLSGHSGRRTDGFDARAVAILGASHTRLRQVCRDDAGAELRVLLDSRWNLVSRRQQVICRLHARLAELSEGGALMVRSRSWFGSGCRRRLIGGVPLVSVRVGLQAGLDSETTVEAVISSDGCGGWVGW